MATQSGNSLYQHGIRWRIAAWVAAALFLVANFIGNHLTDEINWTLSDFIFAGVLLFGSLGVYEIAVRTTRNAAYRAGVGLAIAAALLLTWINAAVGITDSVADLAFLGVPGIAVVGALLARFRAGGMAAAMLATAFAIALVGVIALISGVVPPHNSALEILGLTGFFVTLFAGAAWLFRRAGWKHAPADFRREG